MSNYYKAQRTRNIYDPLSVEPFRLSRSKLELFLNCPRCFYLDRRLGVGQPPGYPFNLNSAVDALLKKEFDLYREKQKPHPLFKKHQLDLVPFKHEKLEEWRDSLCRGISAPISGTNLILTGGVDDLWLDRKSKELVIVDYKATSKKGEVSIHADWQIGYRRQLEIYQHLFRANGFTVSNTTYLVYCNGLRDRDRFDARLEFNISIIPYVGDATWVEAAVRRAYDCLRADIVPSTTDQCDFCQYHLALEAVLKTTSNK